MKHLIWFALALGALVHAAAAQQLNDRFVGGLEPLDPGTVQIFESPPGGFFNLPGATTDTVVDGGTLAITDTRRVGSFGGKNQWYEVSPIDDAGQIGAPLGWIPFEAEDYEQITPSQLFSRIVEAE
ncbi:MAG: hypothetical protein AAFU41_08595 [Pseudomonadota bacterium]